MENDIVNIGSKIKELLTEKNVKIAQKRALIAELVGTDPDVVFYTVSKAIKYNCYDCIQPIGISALKLKL